MGWFDAFRTNGWNTYYSGRDQSPVLFDVQLIIVAFFVTVISIAFLLVVVGSRGRDRWMTFCKMLFTFQTGAIILLCLTGQNWQEGDVHTHCSYIAQPGYDDVTATVGVRIGLKSVNITMTGKIEEGAYNYNERFSMKEFTDMDTSYRDARRRGLPETILYVAEYFHMDEGGLRWTRNIRLAGHFAYILLWSSFASWIVANILVCFDVARGSLLLTLTGLMMVGACVIYALCQPSSPLVVRFVDAYLRLHYGWCFWLCLVSGVLTLVVGAAVFVFYVVTPRVAGKLFLLDWSFMAEEEARDEGETAGPLELDTPNFKRKMAATVAASGGNMFDNVAYDKDDDECCNGATTATHSDNTVPAYDDVRSTTPPLTSTVIQVTA
ncbi:hypothetical protein NP493_1195g00004 [Ridgeia piscesae]|uniref:Uncharacterized protein n=1 Tax=Ridgeia piscesae TaxID=27915 RepID=A0AAD9KDM0_RIDPI|nr:hypothetical protein NP493_1195g00004 [Ridgeia piscesae]